MIGSTKALIYLTLTALAPRLGFNPGLNMAECEALHPDVFSTLSEGNATAILNALTADITTQGDITESVNQIISVSLQNGAIKTAINGVFQSLASTEVASIGLVSLNAIPATFATLDAARTAVNDLRADVDSDLHDLAAKLNALIASLASVGLVSGT